MADGIVLLAGWMPSHLTETDIRPSFVSLLDIRGNAQADHYVLCTYLKELGLKGKLNLL